MGAEPNSHRQQMFAAFEKLLQLASQRVYCGWKQNKWLRNVLGYESKVEKHKKVLVECVKKVLDEKRVAKWSSSRESLCLLNELAADESLRHEHIATTLLTCIVLRYDRLSAATCFALMELSQQEKVQEIIQLEVKNPMESFETLKSIKIESFWFESYRHRVTSIITKYVNVGIPFKGFSVPPETSVFLFLYGTGRDPQRFENPETFDMNGKHLSETFVGYRMDVSITLVGTLLRIINL